MNSYIEINAIVEGSTEENFVKRILAPYLSKKSIFMTPTQISKPGQNGGDVRFVRVQRDIGNFLKQRSDTFVTTMVDYYGIGDWPGTNEIPDNAGPDEIANVINEATSQAVAELFPNIFTSRRFIPYIAIHEFEALLFSDPGKLASKLQIGVNEIEQALEECGEPEAINNDWKTAPSKRLARWSKNEKYHKITSGIVLAEEIGINRMRKKCPQFHDWLCRIENLIP